MAVTLAAGLFSDGELEVEFEVFVDSDFSSEAGSSEPTNFLKNDLMPTAGLAS